MIQDGLNISQQAAGEVQLSYVRDDAWSPATCWVSNLVMYDAATLLAELLRGSPDGKSYQLGAIYLLFENNGGAAVSPPVFDRSGGKSFFDGLSSDPTMDYLRVPLTAITMDSTDAVAYPRGNRVTVFGQTEGVTGTHGKTFSDTVSSRIFGGAIVAAPVFADQTQDLVYARFDFASASDQLVKLAGSQIGVTYRSKLL